MPDIRLGFPHTAGPRLCKWGGWAALALLAYSMLTMVQLLTLGGQPAGAQEAFQLLQRQPLIGLARLDLPTLFALPLYYVLFAGLLAALKDSDGECALLSTLLAVAGVTLLLATPTALSMLTLAEKHRAAASEEDRRRLLAAGEALLASDIWHGTGAIIGGILLQAGSALISAAMLRGAVFSRATAWLGIAVHGLDLLHILIAMVHATAGAMLMALAGPLYPVWFLIVGRRLLHMGNARDAS